MRWQHLNPSSESGKHALELKRLAFGDGFAVPSLQAVIAATCLGMLTVPSVISAGWMNDTAQVPKASLAESKQVRAKTVEALDILKRAVLNVTKDAPCEHVPELQLCAEQKQQLDDWLQNAKSRHGMLQVGATKPPSNLKRPQASKG